MARAPTTPSCVSTPGHLFVASGGGSFFTKGSLDLESSAQMSFAILKQKQLGPLAKGNSPSPRLRGIKPQEGSFASGRHQHHFSPLHHPSPGNGAKDSEVWSIQNHLPPKTWLLGTKNPLGIWTLGRCKKYDPPKRRLTGSVCKTPPLRPRGCDAIQLRGWC